MRLIVESGATKTAWRAVTDSGCVRAMHTAGLSLTCLDAESAMQIVKEAVPALDPEGETVREVDFYGAGIVSRESVLPLIEAFGIWCPLAEVRFYSDLLAAARALFADGSGIVAIMGTGSNSCLYENGKIVSNILPGGYILGDEGGAVSLGRAFISDFIKNLLPEQVMSDFKSDFGLDYAQIVSKVYKEPSASAFLASFAPFVIKHVGCSYVRRLLDDCLEAFVSRSLARYPSLGNGETGKVGVVGSFGCACEPYLKEVGQRYGLEFVRFLQSPADRLVAYHCPGINK